MNTQSHGVVAAVTASVLCCVNEEASPPLLTLPADQSLFSQELFKTSHYFSAASCNSVESLNALK